MAFDTNTAPTSAALTFDAPALKAALAMAAHVIEKRNSIPILAAVKAVAWPGNLALTATDLDMSLTVTIPADTTDHGQAVLWPAPLASAVAKVKGKAALMFDGPQMVFEAGGATMESGDNLAAEDFPTMAPALYQGRAELPASVLLAALSPLLHCISTEAARYYLNGVFIHGHQASATDTPTLRLVATDGHRMGRYDLPQAWQAGCLILPRKAAEVLAKLLKGSGDAPVQISTAADGKLRMHFEGPGWMLESKAIDGTFPDYTRVLPTTAATATFMLTAAEIPTAKGRDALPVKLDADAGAMSWVNRDTNTTASRPILADGTGAVGFNARYLADFAKTAPDGLTIEDTGQGCPARVLTSDSRFLGVLMPMRV